MGDGPARDDGAATTAARPATSAVHRTLLAVLVPAALAVAVVFAVTAVLQLARPLAYGLSPLSFTVAGQPYLGPHEPLAWLLGGLGVALGAAVGITRGWGARRWFRLVLGLLGGVALALLGTAVWELVRPGYERVGPFPWDVLAGLAAAVVAGALGALGQLAPPPRRRALRVGVPVVAGLALGAFGLPTLADAWDWYRPQEFSPFTLELVAARRAFDRELLEYQTDVVESEGTTYVLDRSERLRWTRDDVRRVLWLADGGSGRPAVGLRLAPGRHGELARHARERLLQYGMFDHDALFLDGRLVLVARHECELLDGRFVVTAGESDASIRALYEALTGASPP
jgi:hypothetical protein